MDKLNLHPQIHIDNPNDVNWGPLSPKMFLPSGYKTDFETIRKECLAKGILYEDPEFHPVDTSIYYSCRPAYEFSWMRPHDIAARYGLNPELYSNTQHIFSLVQGELGDYWLLSAATSLCDNADLMCQIIPSGQTFNNNWYAGVFHFYFWRYGQWQEVIIDDRIPTLRGEQLFIHSKEPQEFWGALLEKAYAKLYGSYEALKSGMLSNALHDLTGGVGEYYNLQDPTLPVPDNLINILFKSMERHSSIIWAINPPEGRPQKHVLPNGLIAGQVYTMTDIREIKLISDNGDTHITLVRLSNPWGSRIVWQGPWSENSEEWNNIAPYDRSKMGLLCRDESELWIEFRDLQNVFDSVDICHQLPDIVPLAGPPRVWRGSEFHGRWRKGVNSGGRPVCIESHWLNPQYLLCMKDPDEDDRTRCTCIIELTQKDRRRHKHRGIKLVDMGFVIYRCAEDYSVPLSQHYFHAHTFTDRCNYFTNTQQITKRFLLEADDYIIIPCTYEPDTEADFMLRVILEENNSVQCVEDWNDHLVDLCITPTDPQIKDREEDFQKFFYDVASQEMEINAEKLAEILNRTITSDTTYIQHEEYPLSLTACKGLIKLINSDHKHSTTVGYHEFLYIWNTIKTWRRIFRQYDYNNVGSMNSYDLRSALASLGYRLSGDVLGQLVFRFTQTDTSLSLSDFIQSMSRLLLAMNIFDIHKKNENITLNMDEWLETVVGM